MNAPSDQDPTSAPPLPQPVPRPPVVTDSLLSAEVEAPETQVGRRYIWLMVLAQFGVFVAFITPLAISLAIKLSQLAPGRDEYLGYITGAGALAVMLAGPSSASRAIGLAAVSVVGGRS